MTPTPPEAPDPPHRWIRSEPVIRIRPNSGWEPPDLRELWDRRELLLNFAIRDLKVRYKQTVLGVVWVILQPLLTALIFTFVFTLVARVRTGNLPYILFAYTGFSAWQIFQRLVSNGTGSMIAASHMIHKVYMPRLILPLAPLASVIIDYSISLAVLVCLMAYYGVMPGVGLLLLPVWLAILISLALGICLFTSSLAVRFRDVLHSTPIVLQLLMYLSPVAYPEALVPERFRAIYNLNPLASILGAIRWSLLGVGEPNWGYLAYAATLGFFLLVAGAMVFKRTERGFADVV